MTKKPDLSKMPTPDLVREFEELATQQGYAHMWLDVPRLKKLYKLVEIVTAELDRRGRLSALSILLEHENVWIRLRAAIYLHQILPEKTHLVLLALADMAPNQVAFEAKMFLRPLPI